MDEKRVKIGVDASEAEAQINRFKQSIEELSRANNKSARDFSELYKRNIKDIESSIDAIKRRSVIEIEGARKIAEENEKEYRVWKKQQEDRLKEGEGKWTSGRFRERFEKENVRRMGDLGESQMAVLDLVKSSKEQIIYLKSLLDETKKQGREGIDKLKDEENERRVEERVLNEAKDKLKDGDEEIRIRNRNFQDKLDEFENTRGGRAIKGTIRALAEPTEFHAAAGILGVIPLVGQGLEALANKAINSAEHLENSIEAISRSTNIPVNLWTSTSAQIRSLKPHLGGMSTADVYDKYMQYATALGGELGEGGDLYPVWGLNAMNRSLPMNEGQLQQLLTIQRYSYKGSALNTGTALEDFMGRSGRSRFQMPEFFDSIVNLITSQIQSGVWGGNMQGAQAVVQGISKAFGMGGIPLNRMLTGVNAGLTNPTSDVANILQMRTLSQIHPGMDVWGLMEEREQGINSPQYMTMMISNLGRYYNRGSLSYKTALKSLFPELSRREVSKLSTLSGGEIGEYIKSEYGSIKNVGEKDYAKSVEDFVGTIEKATKRTDTFFQNTGESLITGVDEIIKKISTLLGGENPEFAKNTESSVSKGVEKGLEEFYRKNPQYKIWG